MFFGGGNRPRLIREEFPHPLGPGNDAAEIELKDIPEPIQEQLFFLLNLALQEAVAVGKMGFLIFRFGIEFSFSPESKAWIQKLRRWLPPEIRMAIEFVSRSWFTDANGRTPNDPQTTEVPTPRFVETLEFIKSLPATTLVSTDEYQSRDIVPTLASPYPARVVPIITQCIGDWAIVRCHRRVGENRVLTDREISDWAARITKMLQDSNGAVKRFWFIWNTNFEMQPFENAHHLAAKLPPGVSLNWKQQYLESQKSNKGSMLSFLAKGAPKKPDASAASPVRGKASRGDEDGEGGEDATPPLSPAVAVSPKPQAAKATATGASPAKKTKVDADNTISKFFNKK